VGSVATTREAPRFWESVREAIRGSEQDFTTGSINRAILLLAIPMVLEMAMESLFAVVDVFWVAHLGSNAVATVGLTESMIILVASVALGLSLSTTAMVARRIGEKDHEGAAVAAVQSIAIGLLVALIVGAIGVADGPALLRLMGAPADMVRVGSSYTRIMLGGCATVILLYLNNAIFRGAGNAAIAMRVLWFANLINLILDPCLIFGLGPFPRWGVTGAATATTIGRGLGVVFQFVVLARGTDRIRVGLKQLRLDMGVMARLVRVSTTGILQFLIAHTSWIGLVRIVAMFGATAIASYTIAIRIVIFAILPSWGMSNAAATLVGQNLGAREPERAEKSVWRTGFYNMVFLGGLGVFFILFAEPVIRLFTTDPAIVPLAAACLRLLSYGNIFYAYGMVMVQAFNGAGDTVTPTIVNVFCYWLWEIPLAYWLAIHAGLQARGAFLSIPIAEGTLAIVSMILFRRGRWKTQQI
jgi:MATE family, multidrug efflux pump